MILISPHGDYIYEDSNLTFQGYPSSNYMLTATSERFTYCVISVLLPDSTAQ